MCGSGVFHGYPNGSVRVYDAITGDRSIVGTGQEPSWLNDGTLIVSDFKAASPETGALGLADVSFVDLRTGKATALPKSIRSIAGVGHFRVSPDGAKLAFDDGAAIFVGERRRDAHPAFRTARRGCVGARLVTRWQDDRVQRGPLGFPPRHRQRRLHKRHPRAS